MNRNVKNGLVMALILLMVWTAFAVGFYTPRDLFGPLPQDPETDVTFSQAVTLDPGAYALFVAPLNQSHTVCYTVRAYGGEAGLIIADRNVQEMQVYNGTQDGDASIIEGCYTIPFPQEWYFIIHNDPSVNTGRIGVFYSLTVHVNPYG